MKKTLTESQLYDYIYNQVLAKLNEDAAALPATPAAPVAPATNTGGQLNGTSSTAVDNIKKEADAGNKKAVDSFNPQGGEQASDNKQQGQAAVPQQPAPSQAPAPQQPAPAPQQQATAPQQPAPISESQLYDIIYKGIINKLNNL